MSVGFVANGIVVGVTTSQAGQSPWIILKVMSRTLNIIRDSTGSQCSSRRAGLMCSYRLVPLIRPFAVYVYRKGQFTQIIFVVQLNAILSR